MSQDKYTLKVKEIHVNRDILAAHIKDCVTDHFDIMFHANLSDDAERDGITESLEFELTGLVWNNEIINFKVIFDKRNNKRSDMAKGKFNLEIQYQEWNCLNVTKLKYDITEKLSDNADIEFITW